MTDERIVPPRNFNPLTASPARLKEYGLPSVKAAGGRKKWVKLMRGVHFSAAPKMLVMGGPANPGHAYGTTSRLWSGYAAQGHANFNEVSAYYDEPYIGSSNPVCPVAKLNEATWVGLGGWYSTGGGAYPYIAQVGTAWGDPNQPNLHNEFQELVIDSAGDFGPVWGPQVTFGDNMYAEVSWGSPANNYTYYIEDQSHTSATINKTNYSAHYNGLTADVVTEHYEGAYMANFGTITFTTAQAGTGTTSSNINALGSYSTLAITLVDGNGDTQAYPNPFYGNGYDFTNNDRQCN
jgi:hypothetical protein